MAQRLPPPPIRAKSKPKSLADLLPQVLKELGVTGAGDRQKLRQAWENVLGAELAAHCRVEGVRQQILHVSVPDSTWLLRLQSEKTHLVARLRQELGADAIKDLRLRIATG